MATASTKYSKMFSERKDTFTTGDDAELKIQLTSTAIRVFYTLTTHIINNHSGHCRQCAVYTLDSDVKIERTKTRGTVH
eukprot:12637-Heterococcus_DN1.PRE.2